MFLVFFVETMSRQRPERRGYALLCFQQHKDRVKGMKGTVDCGPPREHPLGNKSEMDKVMLICLCSVLIRSWIGVHIWFCLCYCRDVTLLRLAKIVQKKTIDNEIHESVATHATFKAKLGLTKKRLEMQRITEENQRLLRRIQEVPPAYNHLDWEEDYRRKDHIKKSMSLYPEFYAKQEAEEALKKSQMGLSRTSSANYGLS